MSRAQVYLGDQGARAVGEGLTGNRSLTDLDLEGCALAAGDIKEGNMNGVAGFLNCVAHDAVLRSLSLKNNVLSVRHLQTGSFFLMLNSTVQCSHIGGSHRASQPVPSASGSEWWVSFCVVPPHPARNCRQTTRSITPMTCVA